MSTRGERIIDHLSGPNRSLASQIDTRLVIAGERGLKSVRRGQGSDLAPLNSNFLETDYDHVVAMLKMVKEIDRCHSPLTRNLDSDFCQRQIVVHDLGEIHPRIGDVPTVGPERESPQGQRRKRLEPYAARGLLKLIKGKPGELLLQAFERYERRHPKDPETLFVKIVDILQGMTRGGLEGFYATYPRFGFEQPPLTIQSHLNKVLRKSVPPFIGYAQLLDMSGRSALSHLFTSELTRLSEAGYSHIVEPVIDESVPQILFPY